MNKFQIKIILSNGITDITDCELEYNNVEEFYEYLKEIRMNEKYLIIKTDKYIAEYNFEHISLLQLLQK